VLSNTEMDIAIGHLAETLTAREAAAAGDLGQPLEDDCLATEGSRTVKMYIDTPAEVHAKNHSIR